MVITLLTTATGSQVATETSISWEQPVVGPVVSGGVLLVFVGAVDSERPSVLSATFSGSALSPFSGQAMSPVLVSNGVGGQSFPCAFIYSLIDPVPIGGAVTGTVDVAFDQSVVNARGMSAIFVGGSGVLDGEVSTTTINTQTPDFSISGSITTTSPGSLVIDFCVSESSNHNVHVFPGTQVEIGNVAMTGPRFSTTSSGLSSPGTADMRRLQTGGPFAGATLGVFALKDI